ncbi:MAG: TVP38/TMEM64 family protein [Candidatus Hydrogenedentes bacterium]|nr:TVP38/TMEM64 family protein [Candidatus Hydrogenedentota bacterium]
MKTTADYLTGDRTLVAARKLRIMALAAAAVLLVLAWRLLPVQAWLNDGCAWLQARGTLGAALFIGLYAVSCLVLFPDVLLNLAAGYVWGVPLATALITVGRGMGASLLFLLVRRLAQRGRWFKDGKSGRFAAVAGAIEKEGFKIALMLRLSPAFPIPWVNVGLGFTRISFRTYLATTLVGLLPRTIATAYLGSGLHSLSAIAPGSASTPPWIFWGGFAVTVFCTLWLTQIARRALRDAAAPVT